MDQRRGRAGRVARRSRSAAALQPAAAQARRHSPSVRRFGRTMTQGRPDACSSCSPMRLNLRTPGGRGRVGGCGPGTKHHAPRPTPAATAGTTQPVHRRHRHQAERKGGRQQAPRERTKQVEDGKGELARALHARRRGQHKAAQAGGAGAHQVAHRHKVRLLRVVAAVPPGSRGQRAVGCRGGCAARWVGKGGRQQHAGAAAARRACHIPVGSAARSPAPRTAWMGRLWCRCSSTQRPRPLAPPAGWRDPAGRQWPRSAPARRQTAAAPCRRCGSARALCSRAARVGGQTERARHELLVPCKEARQPPPIDRSLTSSSLAVSSWPTPPVAPATSTVDPGSWGEQGGQGMTSYGEVRSASRQAAARMRRRRQTKIGTKWTQLEAAALYIVSPLLQPARRGHWRRGWAVEGAPGE